MSEVRQGEVLEVLEGGGAVDQMFEHEQPHEHIAMHQKGNNCFNVKIFCR